MNPHIQPIIEGWGLKLPDARRIERAEEIVRIGAVWAAGRPNQWTVHWKHTVTLDGAADCTCQDFRTRQQALGLACKHIIALAVWMDAGGVAPPAPIPVTTPLPEDEESPSPAEVNAPGVPDAEPSQADQQPATGNQPPASGFVGWQAAALLTAP